MIRFSFLLRIQRMRFSEGTVGKSGLPKRQTLLLYQVLKAWLSASDSNSTSHHDGSSSVEHLRDQLGRVPLNPLDRRCARYPLTSELLTEQRGVRRSQMCHVRKLARSSDVSRKAPVLSTEEDLTPVRRRTPCCVSLPASPHSRSWLCRSRARP